MKKTRRIGIGLVPLMFGGCWWSAPPDGTLLPAAPLTASTEQAFDSTLLVMTGEVGAGGSAPLLARTQGRVKSIFFSGGDYARQGQLLVKLDNHTFVTAPRAGFLGSVQIVLGEYINKATPVTALSRHSFLVVPVLLPGAWRLKVQPDDSVRVQAVKTPARTAAGTVGQVGPRTMGDVPVEILLPSRAPFRIGETVSVRLAEKVLPHLAL